MSGRTRIMTHGTRTLTLRAILLGLLLGHLAAVAGEHEEQAHKQAGTAIRLANRAEVARISADWEAAAAESDAIRTWPGILADRDGGFIRFYAEATGISHSTPVEFFLIGEASGHDYEALAIALARPLHIREALHFIGMPDGRPVDPQTFRFWPKGDRAAITIKGIRAETLILDAHTGAPLRSRGLIFTGSRLVPDPGAGAASTNLVPSAEYYEPYAIAANYNEPKALFDVPWQAAQGSVYAKQSANPEHLFKEGEPLPVEIRRISIDGAPYARTLLLTLAPGSGGISVTEQGVPADTDGSLDGALAHFAALRDQGFDCYVQVRFADQLPLAQATTFASVLEAVDVDQGIRIEPPDPGQLFYRAYIPPAAYASRSSRLEQPWELHLARHASPDTGTWTGTLTQLTETWDEKRQTHTLTATDHPVRNGHALKQTLDRIGPGLPVIVLFVPDPHTIRIGELTGFIRPVLESHPMVFVFPGTPTD